MDLLKEKSKKLALDISVYQKDIDSNTKDDSWKAYKSWTESENVLSKKYDRLFSKENKK
jgi:hypothetical protein